MCRERIASMRGLVVSTIGLGKTCISAIKTREHVLAVAQVRGTIINEFFACYRRSRRGPNLLQLSLGSAPKSAGKKPSNRNDMILRHQLYRPYKVHNHKFQLHRLMLETLITPIKPTTPTYSTTQTRTSANPCLKQARCIK